MEAEPDPDALISLPPNVLRIPCVRIDRVQRAHAGRATVGDWARARLDPGLIEFLEISIAGRSLGAGYEPRYTVPYGLIRTAAGAAVEPAAPGGGTWTIRGADLTFLDKPELHDVLLAEASIIALDARLASFDVSAGTIGRRPLLTGRLRLAATVGGRRADLGDVHHPAVVAPGASEAADHSRVLASIRAPKAIAIGRTADVTLAVANPTETNRTVTVDARVPYGAGLSIESEPSQCVSLGPGGTALLHFHLRADRPDEVNLSRPWTLLFTARAGDIEDTRAVDIAVPDPEPGRVFYVLTEDCETFDGGRKTGDYGDWSVLGNANNFMDPEEYRVQMIAKPARMNEIAEQHGAKWTHFWCVPQRFAAEWAAAQSPTGAWVHLLDDLDDSIRRGSLKHEYAPHVHFGYEPRSALPPQPRLIYDDATDGILPNDYYDPVTNPRHRWHDWDGAARGVAYLKRLGDLATLDSKAGSLFRCHQFLAKRMANRRHSLIARTGSFDFGEGGADQRLSTRAYEANGLLGNSDAYLVESGPLRGNQMFWCCADERRREIPELTDARLVQLAVTHDTDFSRLEPVNRWFGSAWEAAQGPGVRVLMLMTHAMFMKGTPDPFRSLEGGAFDVLDQHLAWVRRRYPDVEFATASEALLEYLDYYSPTPLAYVEPMLSGGSPFQGHCEYPVRLLGRGIRVSLRHPARLRISAPPAFDPSDVARLRVWCDGAAVAVEDGPFQSSARPAIAVELTKRPGQIHLEVQLQPWAIAGFSSLVSDGPAFSDPPEGPRPPLWQIRQPAGRFSMDLVRLLMHPISGHDEPLGHRLHPLGAYPMGIAISAAKAEGGNRIRRLKLRWRHSASLDAVLTPATEHVDEGRLHVRVTDEMGTTIVEGDVWIESRGEGARS